MNPYGPAHENLDFYHIPTNASYKVSLHLETYFMQDLCILAAKALLFLHRISKYQKLMCLPLCIVYLGATTFKWQKLGLLCQVDP